MDDVYTPTMREAMRLLLDLNKDQRTLLFCWFCFRCGRHVKAGESFCEHPA